MTMRMTDREAIRRVTELVERLAYATDIELLAKDAAELRRGYAGVSAEPAAQTDDDTCEHGFAVCEQCAYARGYEDGKAFFSEPAAPTLPGVGPRDCPDDGTAMIQQRSAGWDCPRCHKHFPAAPTVTREQAEEVIFRAMASITTDQSGLWAGFRADGVSWPAFFRAVADALDKEA